MSRFPPHAMNKVVSLNGLGRERSPGQRILGECRDQLVSRLSVWLREVATPISEELFVLADSTRERLLQTRYLDLRATIEKDWPHLVETFRRALISEADRCQTQASLKEASHEKPLELPDFDGLQLVDDADLSEHIVIREFAAQISETCDEELYTLNRRIATLLDHHEVIDGGNPLAPSIICQALSEACATIGTDAEARLLLLRRLERHLHRGLPPIYHQINLSLIERGILPDLKRNYRKNTVFGETCNVAASTQRETANSGTTPKSDTSNADQGTPPSGEYILERLLRLAQTTTSSIIPSGTPLTNAAIASRNAISVVPETAIGDFPQGQNTTQVKANDLNPALFASLNALQHAPLPRDPAGPQIVNQIRRVRESEDAQQIGGLAAVTIDIVAMLFDFIFDDNHVPIAIKALLSRLQIPVLKVAMLNPGFFADRQHPTRRFLGSVSGISIRWGRTVDESDPFYGKLAKLIERIQNEFENDIEIFGTALTELEIFVKEREEEEDSITLAATRIVLQREQEAMAGERARRTVDEFCIGTVLPPLVSDFLTTHWTGVLKAAALGAEGNSQNNWQTANRTMQDLAWSIEAKKTPDDRLKLIGLLPKLLGQINAGLDRINAAPELRQAFFDELVKYHSAALKGERRPTNNTPEQPSAQKNPGTEFQANKSDDDGDLLITHSIDNGIKVEEIVLVGDSPVWRTDDREIYRRVSELKRGDWVEFREAAPDNEGSVRIYRERLHWISPQRGILLFSNHHSASAISITPEALAKKMRDGLADIVQPDEIFEKALSGALESMDAS